MRLIEQKLIGAGKPHGFQNLVVRGKRVADQEIVPQRAVKQAGLLEENAGIAANIGDIDQAHRRAIEQDIALARRRQPRCKPEKCRFPGTDPAKDRDAFTGARSPAPE